MKFEQNHIKGPMWRLRREFVVMENMTSSVKIFGETILQFNVDITLIYVKDL